MNVNDIIQWYENNADAKLNEQVISYMLKIGIINEDDNIDAINKRLIARYNNKPIINNSKYQVKDNIKDLISYFSTKQQSTTKPINRFKIEKINGKKMRLIKQ